MSTPIKNITLEFPCQEKWDQLEVVPGGRLCESCAHVVRDFRDCSANELNAALKSQSHVCGIFKREQLSGTFIKAAVVAIAATTLGACETEQSPAPSNTKVPSLYLQHLESSLEEVDTTAEFTLGVVVRNPDPWPRP